MCTLHVLNGFSQTRISLLLDCGVKTFLGCQLLIYLLFARSLFAKTATFPQTIRDHWDVKKTSFRRIIFSVHTLWLFNADLIIRFTEYSLQVENMLFKNWGALQSNGQIMTWSLRKNSMVLLKNSNHELGRKKSIASLILSQHFLTLIWIVQAAFEEPELYCLFPNTRPHPHPKF